jgi:hypothetical protein
MLDLFLDVVSVQPSPTDTALAFQAVSRNGLDLANRAKGKPMPKPLETAIIARRSRIEMASPAKLSRPKPLSRRNIRAWVAILPSQRLAERHPPAMGGGRCPHSDSGFAFVGELPRIVLLI